MNFLFILDRLLNKDGAHEALLPARPEPVLDEAKAAASITAVITTLAGLAVTVGFIAETDAVALTTALGLIATGAVAVTNYVISVRRAYAARAQVTPLSDPVLSDVP